MKLLIHDLNHKEFQKVFPNPLKDTQVISDDGTINHCVGCFGCWIKTPATCVIRDKYGDMGEYLSKCDEVIVISRCCYGGFSPFVKNVFDRSISYVQPYFMIKNGEMHHRRRYNNKFHMKVWFYGENVTEKEKETAKKLVASNSANMNYEECKVTFVNRVEDMEGNIL
ncbi:MAG: flavodoxin family protein [Clostridium sp.]|uniref:flavodoxin family protein n=1 Tax=Clostridium sp. TaxID=1506 RepID=UPI003074B88C